MEQYFAAKHPVQCFSSPVVEQQLQWSLSISNAVAFFSIVCTVGYNIPSTSFSSPSSTILITSNSNWGRLNVNFIKLRELGIEAPRLHVGGSITSNCNQIGYALLVSRLISVLYLTIWTIIWSYVMSITFDQYVNKIQCVEFNNLNYAHLTDFKYQLN